MFLSRLFTIPQERIFQEKRKGILHSADPIRRTDSHYRPIVFVLVFNTKRKEISAEYLNSNSS